MKYLIILNGFSIFVNYTTLKHELWLPRYYYSLYSKEKKSVSSAKKSAKSI